MQSEREMASQRHSLGQQSQGGAGQDSDYTFSTVPKEFFAIVHQNTVRTLPSRSHVPSLEIPLYDAHHPNTRAGPVGVRC